MATITIDGTDYDTEDLSDTAKGQVLSLQFVQSELKRLEAQTAVFKTAEVAYTNALQKELDNLS
tara:strand:- start:111 stop:302 length:192 start_codon:yes stop_codon:yes gene_type:complete